MKEICINSRNKNYKVYIDNDISKIFLAFNEHKLKSTDKFYIITDDKVYSLYEKKLKLLMKNYNYKIFVFNQGEENKTYKTVEEIYNFLIENNADRNSILIAFGGGIVGDTVGFVAATFMRGIKYINVPTTLISQVDSAIGGKVAYNIKGIKNAIGCFYDPIFVFVSVNFLKTLNKMQFISGLGEVIKYGLIESSELLKYIKENIKAIMELENDKLLYIVKECLKIKASVVEKDYEDLGYRNILNFGHTIGHAIESDSNYLTSIKISEMKLKLNTNIYKEIENLYKKINIETFYKVDNLDLFLYSIKHDKKMEGNNIKFTLLEDVGACKIKIDVSEEEIIEALKESIGRSY